MTDIQTTFAEWEVYVPATHQLLGFEGSMAAARGLTYSLRDAWIEFAETCRDLVRNTAGLLVAGLVVGLLLLFIVNTIRRGWRGALSVAVGVAILTIIGGMLLPALSRAKSKALRISAVNNLKQIGLALRQHIEQEKAGMPATLDELKQLVGSEVILTDPESGRRFEYIAAGQETPPPDAIVAYSPIDRNGRAVLLGDGSVVQMRESQFHEALSQSQARWSMRSTAETGQSPDRVSTAAGPSLAGADTQPGLVTPLVNGLRPVRVEIPRSGRKYIFTKVLNVRDEALTFEAWAVNARLLHTARASIQVMTFLGGLFLLYRQWRRDRPSAFLLALSLAAIAGSVGHLLLTYRLLGRALVLVVPLLILVAAALLLRRFLPRAGASSVAERTDPFPPTVPPPVSPPSSPSVPPSVGPAVATLCLLASLMPMTARTAPNPEDTRVIGDVETVPFESASYTGTVRDHVAHLTADLRIHPLQPNRTIPLFGPEVAVESFEASSSGARLIRQGDRLLVRLTRPIATTLTLRLLVPLEGDVTRRRLGFALPGALVSRLSVTLNETEAAVECPAAVTFETIPSDDQTRVEAVLGAAERVELSWTPRVKRAAETAATVFCENLTLATFGAGAVRLRSRLDYQVTQGELGELRVLLPPESRLLRVEGESIRTWEVRAIDQAAMLVVGLIRGSTSSYRLLLELERSSDSLPSTVPLTLPRAQAVNRETGFLALAATDELALSAMPPPEFRKIDVTEFQQQMSDIGVPVVEAYRFLQPPSQLPVRMEPLQPQLTAVTHHRFRIASDQIDLAARIDYTIKRTGLFRLQLALPDEYRVETVTGAGIAQWLESTTDGSRRLELALEHRVTNSYTLQVQLTRSLTELPAQLALVSIHPLDIEKQTGSVVVTSDTGIQVRSATLDGLTEVPAGSVPEGGTGLAFRLADAGRSAWKLDVTTGILDAWVRAELLTLVSLGESLVSGRTRIRYEIQHAPVRELRLRIPESLRHVEIDGANVRRRERTGEEWIIELQNRAIGVENLIVTWEQPWQISQDGGETPFTPPAIHTLGVERETGQIFVLTRAQLQVDPRTLSTDIIRVDPQDVPVWAGTIPESALLSFRYLRPGYSLTLAARRFAQAPTLQAVIDDARLTSVVSDDGQMMTELALMVRNNGRQFLEIGLPDEPNVWSVFVAGEAVRPSVRDGRLLVPLQRNLEAPFPVELVYVDARPFPRKSGRLRFLSPVVDLPIKSARWEVYLPPDYSYDSFGGTMTYEATGLPELRGFSFGDYSQLEVKNRRFLDKSALDNLDVARRQLASGRVEEAAASLQLAQRYGLKSNQRTNEARELERELNRALSSNLLQAQREVIANNVPVFPDDPLQRRALPAARYDDVAAGQQLARIQQVQEVATRGIRPLRVNLPVRGFRHSFSQLLQTETGKPMEIHFRAANHRIPNWPVRVAWTLCGFLLLWAATAWTVRNIRARTEPSP